MRVNTGVSIFGSAIFLPILILGLLSIGSRQTVFFSPFLHLTAILIMLISGFVFWLYASRGFMITGSQRTILIALSLLLGSLFFLAHGLFFEQSFSGAFNHFSARATWYSQLASLILSLGLLLAVGFSERAVKPSERRRTLWVAGIFVLVLLAFVMILIEAALLNDIEVAATIGRWTPLGRFFQITTIMFLTVASIRYLFGAFLIRSEIALAFATGAVLLVMGELTYALAQTFYDLFFWVSHLWYVMGYLAFVWGGYVSRVTHQEAQLS